MEEYKGDCWKCRRMPRIAEVCPSTSTETPMLSSSDEDWFSREDKETKKWEEPEGQKRRKEDMEDIESEEELNQNVGGKGPQVVEEELWSGEEDFEQEESVALEQKKKMGETEDEEKKLVVFPAGSSVGESQKNERGKEEDGEGKRRGPRLSQRENGSVFKEKEKTGKEEGFGQKGGVEAEEKKWTEWTEEEKQKLDVS